MVINWTELIIGICSVVITFVVIPLIQKLKKESEERLTADQLATVEYWTECGVRWAKQWLATDTGKTKKAKVMAFLTNKMQEIGVDISADDLDKIVEAVYEQVKKEV